MVTSETYYQMLLREQKSYEDLLTEAEHDLVVAKQDLTNITQEIDTYLATGIIPECLSHLFVS